jgi:uncharacterized membrane protein YesL
VHNSTDFGLSRAYDDLSQPKETVAMLSTIVIILLVLWLLGAFVVPVGGSLIHLLLVIAVIVILIRVIQGRNPVSG